MTEHWLSIEQAANLSGKSTTTIRRAVAALSEAEKTQHIKRVQVPGAGGNKILISRELIVERWQITEQHNDTGVREEWPLERLVSVLEKQIFSLNRELDAKNRIIDDYSRLAADLTNSIREQTIINGTLQNKILLSAGSPGQTQTAQHSGGWYWVAVVLLGAVLFLFLLLVA